MNELFLVVELQTINGNIAALTTSYDSLLAAQQKFHTIAAAAAASNLEKHSVSILNTDGFSIETAHFEHNQMEA